MKIKKTIAFLVCVYLSFWAGYFLRSIHYRQDLPRFEKEDAEIRLALKGLERERMLMEAVNKLLLEYEEIIFWNHDVREEK